MVFEECMRSAPMTFCTILGAMMMEPIQCMYVCMYVCMCVCVCERERERDKKMNEFVVKR